MANRSIARRPGPGRSGLGGVRFQEALFGYLMIGPWLVGFLIFVAGPMVFSLFMTFNRWEIVTPREWIGLGNFRELIRDDHLGLALSNTAYYALFGVPSHLLLALIAALALNRTIRGVSAYRTLLYLPSVTPIVASSLLWLWIFNSDFGLANGVLNLVGLPSIRWFHDSSWSKPAFIIMSWWTIGPQMVILLAGLKSISESYYDAASIDGAGTWRKFWHITLPMLSPALFFNLVLAVIASLQVFTQAYVMTGGGPGNSTLFYVLYLYFEGFENFNMGYASSLAWVLFLIILTFTLIQFRLANRWVFYEGELR